MRKISLTGWIIVAMVAGVIIGWLNHEYWPTADMANILGPFSTIFISLIKAIVVPLIFSALVVGIAGHGDDLKRVGKLALRSIIYFEVVTTIALIVGLAMVNLLRPGVGVALAASADAGKQFAATHTTFASVLTHSVGTSFFDSAAKNEVLQVVVFTVIFGAGLSRVKGRAKETMLAFCESLAEVMFKFTEIVMKFAPIGIGAAVAVTVGHSGIGVLKNLGALVLTLYAALAVFALVALLPVALIARIPVRLFWKYVKEPYLIAFSTASSEAALPLAMENMEKMGVPKRIVAFVLPAGYSFNLDGSTLYLAVASVFVAQAAGVDMPLGTQILMMLTLMLTSKGVAAVPRAALVILSGTLTSFNLPLEGVAVILGVDALMDMARTSINLLGNCLASAVMARWEGEFVPTE
ncbi:MAG TPA: dicarboxylate/amino acid:cation symporter [Gemmatimonadales bacterium]|jgi:proton glutamate symport protein|nr:dicarboxylate/amino acid:cation symporter [Gemmatimonadales bacterium]